MTALPRLLSSAALLSLVWVLTGCGPAPLPICDVSGAVTVNGKPMDDGEITFVDDNSKVPSANCPVKGGAFKMPVTAGKKKVRVYMKVPVAGTNPTMFNEGLPGRYNADTELKGEVDPKSQNKFDFKLTLP